MKNLSKILLRMVQASARTASLTLILLASAWTAQAQTEETFKPGINLTYNFDRSIKTHIYLDANNRIRITPTGGTPDMQLDYMAGTGSRLGLFNSSGVLAPLANGADGTFLSLVAGVPAWVASPTPTGEALTKTDDTNVTLTLGGTPGTALLQPTSLTLGWTGDLAFSRLAQGSARSVLGVSGGSTADVASIAAGTDHQVLRRSGTSIGFGSINLAQSAAVTGVLDEVNGGTGQSTVTAGDILYGSAPNTFSKLAGVATGNALISGGVSTAPSWGKVGLTTHVSGTLPVANGGTGATTLTGYLKGNGTSAFTGSATIPNTDITGLGTMSTQNANAVAITGGAYNGTVGLTTPAAVAATSITGTSGRITNGANNTTLSLYRATNATSTTNQIRWFLNNFSGVETDAGYIQSSWRTNSLGAENSKFEIQGVVNGVSTEFAEFSDVGLDLGVGALQFEGIPVIGSDRSLSATTLGIGITPSSMSKIHVRGSSSDGDVNIRLDANFSSVPGVFGRFQTSDDNGSANSYYTYLSNGAWHTNNGNALSFTVENQFVDGQVITLGKNAGFQFLKTLASSPLENVTASEVLGVRESGDVLINGSTAISGTRAATFTKVTSIGGGAGVFQDGSSTALLVGADLGTTSLTTATRKLARIGAVHYTNSEEPIAMIFADGDVSNNIVHIGGGTSIMNAATDIRFHTGATTTTTTGTEAMRINSSQIVSLTNALPATSGGTGTATVTAGDILYGSGANTWGKLAKGTAGQVLKMNAGATAPEWGAATGDVTGPASSTDNAVVRFDATTGKIIQNSGVTIDDSNNVAINTATATSKLHVYESTTSTGATAGVTIENASTGDAVLHFVAGGTTWTSGIDNSSSDTYKIQNSSGLTTGSLELTTAGLINLNGTPQVSNSTALSTGFSVSSNTSVGGHAALFTNDGNSTDREGILITAGLDDHTLAGPSTLIDFSDGNGTPVGSVTFGSSVTAYNTTSDYRLKEDFKDFSGLSLAKSIPVYNYRWKGTQKSRSYGVKAHELQKVLPYAVTGKKDAVDENGQPIMQQADYSKIVPILLKAIQEQQEQLEALQARVKALEKK